MTLLTYKMRQNLMVSSLIALCALNPALATHGASGELSHGLKRSLSPSNNSDEDSSSYPTKRQRREASIPETISDRKWGKQPMTQGDKNVQLLLNASETKDFQQNKALVGAINSGDVKTVRNLLSQGVDINNTELFPGTTPLHMAIARFDIPMITLLLSWESIDVTLVDMNGNTPLHLAAHQGHWPLVQMLLQKDKTCLDVKNNMDFTPEQVAEEYGHQNLLLQIGHFLDPNESDPDESETSTSDDSDGLDPNAPTYPFFHAIFENDLMTVNQFLGSNDLINMQDPITGETALHLAVIEDNIDMVRTLTQRNPHMTLQDRDGNTPLHYAVHNGNWNIIEMLLCKIFTGIPKNRYQDLIDGNYTVLNIQNNDGETPYDIAMGYEEGSLVLKSRELIKQLIEESLTQGSGTRMEKNTAQSSTSHKAHPVYAKATLSEGDQMLFEAIAYDNEEFISTAKALGANINATNHKGKTALHLAIGKASKPLTRLLLENGADVTLLDPQGQSCFDLALATGDADLVEILSRYL